MTRETAGSSSSQAGGARPFRFLRHGLGLADGLRLWVVLQDGAASAQPVADALLAWARGAKLKASVRVDGPALVLSARFWKKACERKSTVVDASGSLALDGVTAAEKRAIGAHAELERALLDAHGKTPLGLVVRENRVKPSAWHAQTMADPAGLLQALKPVVRRGEYSKPRESPRVAMNGKADVRDLLLGYSRGSVPAELVETTLQVLWQSADKAGQAVLHDLLVDELPGWLGADFDVDVVLREALAGFGGLSATSIKMPKQFDEEVERRLAKRHRETEWRLERKDSVDWTKPAQVVEGMAQKQWAALESGFEASERTHIATLLGLTDEQRLALVSHGQFATRIANAAVYCMTSGNFAGALTLYDAALEGRLDPMAAANPLYAVQDDNNHLGVDEARSRRYLERCLKHGPGNPTIFLNASFVFMEVNEPAEALRVLELAKKHGINIKSHRNEGLFAPLRENAEFKRLMR